MLDRRRRRRTSIEPTLGHCLVVTLFVIYNVHVTRFVINHSSDSSVLRLIGVHEESHHFVPQEFDKGLRKHGVRDIGVFEVVVRLRYHFQKGSQQLAILKKTVIY